MRGFLWRVVSPRTDGLEKHYGKAVQRAATRSGLVNVDRDEAWMEFISASHQLNVGLGRVLADGTTDWGKYDFISADFTGVLLIRRNFHVRKHGGGNGWGHLGMSRFLLLFKSVSNVSPHPR